MYSISPVQYGEEVRILASCWAQETCRPGCRVADRGYSRTQVEFQIFDFAFVLVRGRGFDARMLLDPRKHEDSVARFLFAADGSGGLCRGSPSVPRHLQVLRAGAQSACSARNAGCSRASRGEDWDWRGTCGDREGLGRGQLVVRGCSASRCQAPFVVT